MDMDRNAVQEYTVLNTAIPPPLNGSFTGTWETAPWTLDFVDIRGAGLTGIPEPRYQTRVKMLHDKNYFYIGAELYDPDIWNYNDVKNSVIFWENDFEVFVDPDGDSLNYYEFEINALNTIWELTLDKPYNQGGTATSPANIDGLISAIAIDGTLNDPMDVDTKWSVTIAIPWEGFRRYVGAHQNLPPSVKDEWRINFSRVQWRFNVVDGKYERIPKINPPFSIHEEDNWVWSTQHEINMHEPKYWGRVKFA